MYTNSTAIMEEIKTILTNGLSASNPDLTIILDEPIILDYNSLPLLCIFPMKEDYSYDESFGSEYKKDLSVNISIRLKGKPASSLATPFVNSICDLIHSNRDLNGLADYVEIQTIQWGNDRVEEGYVCGASIDLQIKYLTQ